MNLDSLFEPEAKAEFFEAIAWYENESPGLGKEFASEVLGAVDRALVQPELFRKVRGRARKIRLKRFKAFSKDSPSSMNTTAKKFTSFAIGQAPRPET